MKRNTYRIIYENTSGNYCVVSVDAYSKEEAEETVQKNKVDYFKTVSINLSTDA